MWLGLEAGTPQLGYCWRPEDAGPQAAEDQSQWCANNPRFRSEMGGSVPSDEPRAPEHGTAYVREGAGLVLWEEPSSKQAEPEVALGSGGPHTPEGRHLCERTVQVDLSKGA